MHRQDIINAPWNGRAFAAAAAILSGAAYGGLALIYAALASSEQSALFLSYLHKPLLAVLNVLPAVLLSLFIWLLTDRAWCASLVTGLAVMGLSCVNFLKLTIRSDPLIAEDMFVFFEAAKAGENYSGYLRPATVLAVLAVAAITALCSLCRGRLRAPKRRIAGALVLAAVSAGLYFTVYASEDVYTKTENMERNSWFMSEWSQTDQYVSRGFLYPLLHSFTDVGDPPPEGYDEDAVASALAEIGDSGIPEDKKVNIVGVMLEAFADFSDLIELEADPYVNFHALAAESVSGQLITNIFAGNTVDTERAFLTGTTDLRNYRSDTGSYVWYLRGQGYKTEGGHPCYGWFYNRQNVNSYLGFEDYWFYETRYSDPGEITYSGMMIDDLFFDDLLGMFDAAAAAGQPYFQFSVTYQNHGPYETKERYFSTEYVAKTPELSDEGYNIINNYLSGIAQTDAAVGKLARELAARDEPVVLVVFGDHKPWLGNGAYVYSELGIDISRSDQQSFENYYATPYLIWANDAAKEMLGNDFTGQGPDISPCFLMNLVFELCSWDGPAYMKAGTDLMQTVPVISSTGVYYENGALTDVLSAENAQKLAEFEKFEYYWRRSQ